MVILYCSFRQDFNFIALGQRSMHVSAVVVLFVGT